MYSRLPGLVLGFHGCDQETADAVIGRGDPLRASHNDYDWLGNGVYFWEHSPQRALEYACALRDSPHRDSPRIQRPAVIGAVLVLGHCLNLLDNKYLDIVKQGHRQLAETLSHAGVPVPQNRCIGEADGIPLMRTLDCAVVEFIHVAASRQGLPPYDSARGAFWEGAPLYENAGFREKSHIQICIRNPNCIKGYFRPLGPDSQYPVP
jgi:hypothetical protein